MGYILGAIRKTLLAIFSFVKYSNYAVLSFVFTKPVLRVCITALHKNKFLSQRQNLSKKSEMDGIVEPT